MNLRRLKEHKTNNSFKIIDINDRCDTYNMAEVIFYHDYVNDLKAYNVLTYGCYEDLNGMRAEVITNYNADKIVFCRAKEEWKRCFYITHKLYYEWGGQLKL